MLKPLPDALFASESDHRACRAAIRTGSRSFYAASWLLPGDVRRSAFALYAFCRLADDAIDLGSGAPALARLQARLDDAYAGRPHDHSADRAFADIVRRHHIPRELALALLEGFDWDCRGRRYENLEELDSYAARVASTVGAMMTLLMGVRDPHALARACDLGVAMQLTNIARDVGEDARAGRLYLPLDWLAEAGLDPAAFLAAPAPSPALAKVIARLLAEADQLYDRARDGIARLPLACRPAILAAAAIYAEIGREIARRDYDSVTERARVGAKRKLALVAVAAVQAPALVRGEPKPAMPAAAFLIEAVAQHRAPRAVKTRSSLGARFVRVLEIFERLERVEQTGR
jgi:15-cis-phytoene synthase